VPARHAQHAGAAGLDRAARLELQDIDPGAADYLTRTQLDSPPDGWQELISRLRQDLGSSLAQAPSNPLMLTLVRDTYQVRDARLQDRLAIQEPRPARLVWQALSQETDHQSVSPLARRRAEHPVRRASDGMSVLPLAARRISRATSWPTSPSVT
jgi:hypothetical protein